jgi:hypothetical protein
VSHAQYQPHTRQRTRCKRNEPPIAGTLFHHLKFSILKAFYIVYYVSTSKHEGGIFDNLLCRMVKAEPCPYKLMIE